MLLAPLLLPPPVPLSVTLPVPLLFPEGNLAVTVTLTAILTLLLSGPVPFLAPLPFSLLAQFRRCNVPNLTVDITATITVTVIRTVTGNITCTLTVSGRHPYRCRCVTFSLDLAVTGSCFTVTVPAGTVTVAVTLPVILDLAVTGSCCSYWHPYPFLCWRKFRRYSTLDLTVYVIGTITVTVTLIISGNVTDTLTVYGRHPCRYRYVTGDLDLAVTGSCTVASTLTLLFAGPVPAE